MERHAELGSPGGAPIQPLTALFVLLLTMSVSYAQTHPDAAQTAEVKRLYEAGRYGDVLLAVPPGPNTPDLELYRGLSQAQLHQYAEAEQTLRSASESYPRDARFPTELGGIAYREKQYPAATAYLRRALRIDPEDTYVNQFLGSTYFLVGNVEAALKFWNRVGQPVLHDFSFDPAPSMPPRLLDQVFPFAPGSVWKLTQYRTTNAELQALDLFPGVSYDLRAQQSGDFHLVLHPAAYSSLRQPGTALVSTLRGLPYQAIDPEFHNVKSTGWNWPSFVRWDDQKRMLASDWSGPIAGNPHQVLRLHFDGRNENWIISSTLLPGRTIAPAGFNMERIAASVALESLFGARWRWTLGPEYSWRRFRSQTNLPGQTAAFFAGTSGFALRSEVNSELLRIPEHRFTLEGTARTEMGSFFTNPLGRYGRVEGALALDWLPQETGEDYAMQSKLRTGGNIGQVPFDDLFLLGFDRDNALWMRGHNGLRDGRKGNAPLGREFVLSNSEINKIVYRNGFLKLRAGPFVDTGNIYDPSSFFGSRKWLTDTGVQFRIRALGSAEFVLGYGRDLRAGRNTFFTTVSR